MPLLAFTWRIALSCYGTFYPKWIPPHFFQTKWSLSCCTLTAVSTHMTRWSCVCEWPSSQPWRWLSPSCSSPWVFTRSVLGDAQTERILWRSALVGPVCARRCGEPSSRCCSLRRPSTGCATSPSLSSCSASSTCWWYLLPTFWESSALSVRTTLVLKTSSQSKLSIVSQNPKP